MLKRIMHIGLMDTFQKIKLSTSMFLFLMMIIPPVISLPKLQRESGMTSSAWGDDILCEYLGQVVQMSLVLTAGGAIIVFLWHKCSLFAGNHDCILIAGNYQRIEIVTARIVASVIGFFLIMTMQTIILTVILTLYGYATYSYVVLKICFSIFMNATMVFLVGLMIYIISKNIVLGLSPICLYIYFVGIQSDNIHFLYTFNAKINSPNEMQSIVTCIEPIWVNVIIWGMLAIISIIIYNNKDLSC